MRHILSGGSGIRTHETPESLLDFKSSALSIEPVFLIEYGLFALVGLLRHNLPGCESLLKVDAGL